MIAARDLFSVAEPTRRWQRIVCFPPVRILVAVAFLLPVVFLHNGIFRFARDTIGQSSFDWFQDVQWIAEIILLVFAYRLYTRVIERRPPWEFSTGGAASETGIGVAIGAVPVLVTVGVMYLAGSYAVQRHGDWTSFVHLLRRFGFGAFLEELVFRVILVPIAGRMAWQPVGGCNRDNSV